MEDGKSADKLETRHLIALVIGGLSFLALSADRETTGTTNGDIAFGVAVNVSLVYVVSGIYRAVRRRNLATSPPAQPSPIARKAVAKKAVAKQAVTKKAVVEKTVSKNVAAKKSPAKKTVAKKSPAKKTAAKKTAAKKTVAKSTSAEITAPTVISFGPNPFAAENQKVYKRGRGTVRERCLECGEINAMDFELIAQVLHRRANSTRGRLDSWADRQIEGGARMSGMHAAAEAARTNRLLMAQLVTTGIPCSNCGAPMIR